MERNIFVPIPHGLGDPVRYHIVDKCGHFGTNEIRLDPTGGVPRFPEKKIDHYQGTTGHVVFDRENRKPAWGPPLSGAGCRRVR